MHSPLCPIPQSTFKLKQYIVIYQYYVYNILFVFSSKRYAEAWARAYFIYTTISSSSRTVPWAYVLMELTIRWEGRRKGREEKKNSWFMHWDYKGSDGIWTRLREMKGLVRTSVLSGGTHSCAVVLGIERKACGVSGSLLCAAWASRSVGRTRGLHCPQQTGVIDAGRMAQTLWDKVKVKVLGMQD